MHGSSMRRDDCLLGSQPTNRTLDREGAWGEGEALPSPLREAGHPGEVSNFLCSCLPPLLPPL